MTIYLSSATARSIHAHVAHASVRFHLHLGSRLLLEVTEGGNEGGAEMLNRPTARGKLRPSHALPPAGEAEDEGAPSCCLSGRACGRGGRVPELDAARADPPSALLLLLERAAQGEPA